MQTKPDTITKVRAMHDLPPLDGLQTPVFKAPENRGMCTNCGSSRMKNANDCGMACQFIKPDYEASEVRIHGRTRGEGNEQFFGPSKRYIGPK